MSRTFVGFGFGAIQAGLFAFEAFQSRNFDRLVVAEVMQEAVDAIRFAGGSYTLNVATRDGIRKYRVDGIEIFNPRVPGDRQALVDAIASATEISTALPSVKFFGSGAEGDVVDLLTRGFVRKTAGGGPRAIVYTGENHNHAAEILREAIQRNAGPLAGQVAGVWQSLNTVIGKMSGVVNDAAEISGQDLAPFVPGASRAFLVEEFNRILITKVQWPDFNRGIGVFGEKDDLLPFEEAKLYGHNATHALMGYLLRARGGRFMADAAGDGELMALVRAAFIGESGGALCRKYHGLDSLFTSVGYAVYVDDLLERMVNPYLRDLVERITRDPARKLGWDDRLVGTMRLVLSQGIEPERYALGAGAALKALEAESGKDGRTLLREVWAESGAGESKQKDMMERILKAKEGV